MQIGCTRKGWPCTREEHESALGVLSADFKHLVWVGCQTKGIVLEVYEGVLYVSSATVRCQVWTKCMKKGEV